MSNATITRAPMPAGTVIGVENRKNGVRFHGDVVWDHGDEIKVRIYGHPRPYVFKMDECYWYGVEKTLYTPEHWK